MPDAADSRPTPHSAEYFGEGRDYWWNQDFIALMAKRLDFSRVRSVLDVGCGVGHWGRVLVAALPSEAVLTGVDRESEWVTKATNLAAKAGLGGRFRYQQGDATRLPFADNTFDLVTCQTVLIHLPDPLLGLREMLRVLKPGGLVLAVEPCNLANHSVVHSLSDSIPTDEMVDAYRMQLTCQRGKKAAGEGFSSVGDLVPGLMASLGVRDVRVHQGDKAGAMFPPYDTPEQRAEIRQMRDWTGREFWVWSKADTRRYFLAGGGLASEFERLWNLVMRHQRDILAGIDAGTYHCAGGGVTYLVSGRKG